MKRLLLAILLCLFMAAPAAGQGITIYLPVIHKGGAAVFEPVLLKISDGTTEIDLLSTRTGFHLESWTPQVIQPKDGGVYQESDIAPGRNLVFAVDGLANEVLNIHVNNYEPDELIRQAQDFMRLLLKARNYWLSGRQDTPVYLIVKAKNATNTQYAIIKNFTIPELPNPYAQPFFSANAIKTLPNIRLGLERDHWLHKPPGIGECTQISAFQLWPYDAKWVTITDAITADAWEFIQISNGTIFAAVSSSIRKSTDNGDTWSSVQVVAAGGSQSIILLSNGYIIAGGNGEIWRSTNNGTSFSTVSIGGLTTNISSLLQTSNGDIYAGGSGEIGKSTDNGATFAVNTTLPVATVSSLLQLPNGDILAGESDRIWYSDDNGASWGVRATFAATEVIETMIQSASGAIFAGTSFGRIWKSTDNGETWYISLSGVGEEVYSLEQAEDGTIWMGTGGDGVTFSASIYKSADDGLTWVIAALGISETSLREIFQLANGALITVGSENIAGGWELFRFNPTPITMGATDTCDNIVYVVNKNNITNLTNVAISDGGVFSELLPMSAFPINLLPAVPATNDALYFGNDEAIDNDGPFSGLVFDLSSVFVFSSSYTITWEYYNGAWVSLTVADGTNSFTQPGVSSVTWTPPTDWTTVTINGVTGYFVRARLSALAGTITPPAQQNRNIYTVTLPRFELGATAVLGDIPAKLQIKLQNQSDEDGRAGSAPNLWTNRLIIGLKTYANATNFQAYLNASDEQNPDGVIVTVGTNTTFAASTIAPTGRHAIYNPAALEAMATRVTFSLGPSIARDFYGDYHAFARVNRTAGVSSDFDIQLNIVAGSGGISKTYESVRAATTTAFELLDFGKVKVPPAGAVKTSELGDQLELNIQASAASGTPNLIFYDLILIPTDEWSIDTVDKANTTESIVGRNGDIPKLLDIDSISNPREPIRTLVRTVGNELVTSIYGSITPYEAIAQANARQRFWVLAAQTSATGTSYSWIAPPEIVHSVQVFKNQRYLYLRGAR